MRPTIVKWDGKHLPKELCELPPGTYLLEVMDAASDLTAEEATGVRAAVDQIEAGRGVPLEAVKQRTRPSAQESTRANGEAGPDLDNTRLRAMQVDWDGTKASENIVQLPPGPYLLSFVDDIVEMSEDEELGVMQALDEMDAGLVFDYEEVMRELRSRYTTDATRPHQQSQG